VSKSVAIGEGYVFYVSFLAGASEASVDAAVAALLQSKIFIPWTASSESEGRPTPCAIGETKHDILVIPQATLAGKLKGKSVQYHTQVAKADGLQLYTRFHNQIRACFALEEVLVLDGNGVNDERGVTTASGRRIFNGTYGNRQALKLDSYGPYTHMFEF